LKPSANEEYDVVVVGGGPAGSTVSALVAGQGHRVLLLEKEFFPRYQIGESLLPSTVHGICELLGVADEVKRAGFTVKHGGTFRWGAAPEPWNFNFAVARRLAGSTAYAYQVERMKFDQILLDNARGLGVEVREGCPVLEVTGDERVTGVKYLDPDGAGHEVSARFVVDASGNTSRIHKRVGGRRDYASLFQNIAVFGYFENGKRLPEPDSGNVLSAAFQDGWLWYIPLSPDLTSVGAVLTQEPAHQLRGGPEKALYQSISRCPMIADYLASAHRVTEGVYGSIRVRKDYSYSKKRFWSRGMVLAGDAACFVDPVFSSGVHLATYSGLLAARSINTVLSGAMEEEPAFREFERRYRYEYAVFYEFLAAFYGLHVDKESYFWQAKKITNCRLSELEAFVELVSGIASGEPTLSKPEDVVEQVATSTKELESALHGGDRPDGTDFVPMHRVPIVERIRSEGASIQLQATFGDVESEPPLFPDGLCASRDGMRWEVPGR
jgi:FAD-dependent halogenase